jgi:predicted DNA-binding helix-hairpin-helix protein
MILRVPGIGVKSQENCASASFWKIHIDLLKKLGVAYHVQNSLFAVKTVQNSKKNFFKFYSAADFNAGII